MSFVEKNAKSPFFLYLSVVIPHANNEHDLIKAEHGMEVPCMVLFAVNGDDNMTNHIVIERGSPCPRYCGNDGHIEVLTQD